MKVLTNILVVIAVLIGITGFAMWNGEMSVFMKKRYGTQLADADREVYQKSLSYVRGKTQELAKYKLQYTKETDPVAKEAIRLYMIEGFADVDSSDINNVTLREFLIELRGY